MATCRNIRGVHRTYKKTWIQELKMRLPVIKPVGLGECKHEGETEPKNGGYVCLKCFKFLSYSVKRYDNKLGKIFSDIK